MEPVRLLQLSAPGNLDHPLRIQDAGSRDHCATMTAALQARSGGPSRHSGC